MKNGRCRLHGGKSTGPKTPGGKAKSANANFKHGNCTKLAKASRKKFSDFLKRCVAQIKEIKNSN
jgi:hypothetical protein